VNAAQGIPGRPLRGTDPRTLGRYRLLGRLGEGGMGVVYLAEAPDGRPVAVKVIRADLSDDPTFRRRFRSEVDRARQVPPFCTAEVLDADPDHDPPYLVVEYVDGPDLATVIEERGPLRPANLHGLAIGVATALTAIHGAGVIHRDLKPSNVLLALGSPKVIDFGIARPVHDASGVTTANQVIGTVAYMSPERLGPAGSPVTPAADIFAWGAVVAYAGTGRTPFSSGNIDVVAARILIQPPELSGLDPTLRGLVEAALAKDPLARPTARALLDQLLAGGPRGGVDLAAAFARQPELAVAAEGAVGIPARSPIARTVRVDPVRRPAARGNRVAVLALALLLVLGTLVGVGLATGRIRLSPAAGAPPNTATTSAAATSGLAQLPVSPSAAPSVAVPSGYVPALHDALTAPGYWQPFADTPNAVSCAFDSRGLVVTKTSAGTYRCPGPRDTYGDFVFSVDVALANERSCAGVWFRFTGTNGGYAARVCPDRYELVTHSGTTITTLRTARFATPVPAGTAIRVGIAVQGQAIRLYRDGQELIELSDGTFAQGRVIIGVFEDTLPPPVPPFTVTYHDLRIWAPGA
jgi:eukaryotic-like serine/threonine-protein kinase